MEVKIFRIINQESGILNITENDLEELGSANIVIPVLSVNEQEGDVVINKSDVGLNEVDNTSDTDKPISTAQQNALDDKADISDIPINTSELTNNGENGIEPFITLDDIPDSETGFYDENGIFQFSSAQPKYEGFDFDVPNEKISVAETFKDKKFFDLGFEVGKYDNGTTYGDERDGLEIYKEGNGLIPNTNPKKYIYKGKNRLSNDWQVYHDFMINEELIARFYGKHQLPYVKYLQVFGSLIVDSIANLNGGVKTDDLEVTNSITLTGTQYGKVSLTREQTSNGTNATLLLETRPSGAWESIFYLKFKNNQGVTFTGIEVEELLDGTISSNSVRLKVNGIAEIDKLDLSNLGSYSDDTAAASGGIAIGEGYINSSTGALHRRLT